MNKAAALTKRFAATMSSSLGVAQQPDRPDFSAVRPTIPMADKNAGRTMDRGKGFMLIDNIIPDPEQPRKDFANIDQLSESIKQFGLLNPIVVKWDQDLGKYKIVSGERRFRATQLLGETSIACNFSDDGTLPASEIALVQLTENIQREELSPMEMATSFKELQNERGWNASKIAAALFVSKALVSQRLKLLDLPDDIKQKVDDGTISASAGYQVAKAGDADTQRAIASRIETEGLTRDQVADATKKSSPKTSKPKPGRPVTKKDFALDNCKVTFTFRKKKVTKADLAEAYEALGKLIKAA